MTISIPPIDIQAVINKLERRDLDDILAPITPPIWGKMEKIPFVRVKGLASFWKENQSGNYDQRFDDLLASAYGQKLEFLYLIISQPREVAIFIGMAGDNDEIILRTALMAAFPGILLAESTEYSLGKILKDAGMFTYRARLTGIPTRKGSLSRHSAFQKESEKVDVQSSSYPGNQVERICRGLAGEGWGMLVHAIPYPYEKITGDSYNCLDTIAAMSSQTKRQIQQLNQTMKQVDSTTQSGSTESISGEIVNRHAEYAVELLEKQLKRLDEAKSVGMWETECHLFSHKSETLASLQSLVRAVYAGSDSRPEPVRVLECRNPSSPTSLTTWLTSVELGTLSQLPREELPGFRITDYARFDTDFPSSSSLIEIGSILDGNRKTGHTFGIPRWDFSKHGLVAGVTGSGKTTTIFKILDKIWDKGQGVPFLVIESAKTEYRRLRGVTDSKGIGNGTIPELRVYTLGDETISPFRINPFEFEIVDANCRTHVQTHIDYLKSLFNAAFILYAPMPYILETCLHEIYTDFGWDLATSRNVRLPEPLLGNSGQWPIFPTLSDLYMKIDQVTDRLGYDERIAMDVKAGLKARVGSLKLGSKGLMLDTKHGVPIKELLSAPTILELERIGNDDEKAFIIGLIMTRIYEYRKVQSMVDPSISDTQHLIVIEEAHRLLKNVRTEVETESANMRGQAVETFANMLAEIRAYGQGVFIAEQIPTKLAADAIKNSNLKIIHRLVAADDREILAQSANMDQIQSRFVGTLPPGRAVVFSEQTDHPLIIEVDNYRKQLTSAVSDFDIAEAMKSLIAHPSYEPFNDYKKYLGKSVARVDISIFDLVSNIYINPQFAQSWAKVFIYLLSNLAIKPLLVDIRQLVLSTCGIKDAMKGQDIVRATLLYATEKSLAQRARYLNWQYSIVEEMRDLLASGLMALMDDSDNLASNNLSEFMSKFHEVSKIVEGPFPGCVECRNRCVFRLDVAVISQGKGVQRDIVDLINQQSDEVFLQKELVTFAYQLVHNIAGNEISDVEKKSIAICTISQAAMDAGFSPIMQKKMVKYISTSN